MAKLSPVDAKNQREFALLLKELRGELASIYSFYADADGRISYSEMQKFNRLKALNPAIVRIVRSHANNLWHTSGGQPLRVFTLLLSNTILSTIKVGFKRRSTFKDLDRALTNALELKVKTARKLTPPIEDPNPERDALAAKHEKALKDFFDMQMNLFLKKLEALNGTEL